MLNIIVLAVIAGLIFNKLFKLLGKVDENDDRPTTVFKQTVSEENKRTVDIEIASAYEAALSQPIRDTFDGARNMDHSFNAQSFINGARKAFEMIIENFNKNKLKKSEHLLSENIKKIFVKELERRDASKEVHQNLLVSIKNCDITDAKLEGSILFITIKFISEQINSVKDHLGNIISGNSSYVETIEDNWIFAKDLKSQNSVWQVVETIHT